MGKNTRTNRERCSLNYTRALQFAELTNAYMFRWLTEEGKWEGKPLDDANINEIIDTDTAFWEIFVEGAPCYLTDTISKQRELCNGTRATHHSPLLDDYQIQDFQMQAAQGQLIITLHKPPLGINIRIDDTRITQANHWKGFQIQPTTTNKTTTAPKKKPPPPIIVPIKPGAKNNRDNTMYVKSPNPLMKASRVAFKNIFPLRGSFAPTVDKVQGQTLERVIVELSEREYALSNFTYACIYVATSRVQKTDNQRLLLKGMANEAQHWGTLKYLTSKKQCPSIPAFFSGFKSDRTNWKNEKWDASKALANFN